MKTGNLPSAFVLFIALAGNATAETRYVDLNSPSPTPPYTTWLTAATNIQDAVDAAVAGDMVLVSNGVYATGSRAVYGFQANRVVINKPISVQSATGPAATVIRGYQVPGSTNGTSAVRCVYLTNGASLVGFTLTGGGTRVSATLEHAGGGLWCASTNAMISNCIISNNAAALNAGGAFRGTLSNCVVVGNHAVGLAGAMSTGGGASASALIHCQVMGNSAAAGGGAYASGVQQCLITQNLADQGGGIYNCSAENCLLVSNTATFGGGAAGVSALSPLRNCTLAGNVAASDGGFSLGVVAGPSLMADNSIIFGNTAYASASANYESSPLVVMVNCCTTPLPTNSGCLGNITNPPVFLAATANQLRLQSNSPCINAGNNANVSASCDEDGRPRIVGGTVDMGACEYQGAETESYIAWLAATGLPTDISSDATDFDGDGANNWHEWRADTVPTDAASALRMVTVSNGLAGLVVSWESVASRSYRLERGEDLGLAPVFQTIATNIPGIAGTKTFNDTSATNGGPYFYRVGVQ